VAALFGQGLVDVDRPSNPISQDFKKTRLQIPATADI
jgi:hypothetical protein